MSILLHMTVVASELTKSVAEIFRLDIRPIAAIFLIGAGLHRRLLLWYHLL
jgi:hypothetical protein